MQLSNLTVSVTPPSLMFKNLPFERRKVILDHLQANHEAVLEHHNRTCRFCGFSEIPALVRQARAVSGDTPLDSSLTLSFVNGDPNDISAGNLAVACVFCAAVNTLNEVVEKQAWAVIYLPGVPQYYLSWIARTMFVVSDMRLASPAMNAAAKVADELDEAAYRLISDTLLSFMSKFDVAQKAAARYRGFGTIDTFATCMVDLAVKDPDIYADRANFLFGFKVIPRACIDDNWSHFFRYRALIQQATSLSGLKSFKDMMRVAHQAYASVYEKTFPAGDPLQMESQMGTARKPAS
jgi:hypothetical protein